VGGGVNFFRFQINDWVVNIDFIIPMVHADFKATCIAVVLQVGRADDV